MLEFKNISKSFGSHKVLTDVSFSVNPGDVVALMGENGAGKSTLMKILSGVYPHVDYSGNIFLDRKRLIFSQPAEAKHSGIAMIFQELGIFNDLTVYENLILPDLVSPKSPNSKPVLYSSKDSLEKARALLERLGFEIDLNARASDLSTGKRQLLEIAKAFTRETSIFIFDEPTSALTEAESAALFLLIDELRKKNKIVFYISHRMDEIKKIATRVLVLRDGCIVSEYDAKTADNNSIIRDMVGREISTVFQKRASAQKTAPILSVANLEVFDLARDKLLLAKTSFDLFAGEILGFGGLIGAGRSEIGLALFGAYSGDSLGATFRKNRYRVSGEVFLEGKKIDLTKPSASIEAGIALLTEDRKLTGLFLNRPASENMTMSVLRSLANVLSVIDKKRDSSMVDSLSKTLQIRGPRLSTEVGLYSGGNQQKVALAKSLAQDLKVLILDEPTRGVDIGAKIEIYELLSKLSERGMAILLISSELPELIGLSDRIAVMREKSVRAFFERPDFNAENIMRVASGVT